MANPIYTYKGIQYEIVRKETDKDGDMGRAEQLLRDFLHCEEKGDWLTISNRIRGGLMWGWLVEITSEENQAQLEGEMSLKEAGDEPEKEGNGFWE